MKPGVLIFLIFHILIKNCFSYLPEDIVNKSDECLTNSLETSLYCRGSRAINNIINNLSKTDKPIVIVRGLEIVPSNSTANPIKTDSEGVMGNENVIDDTSNTNFIARFAQYLQTHELNIKFSELMSMNEGESQLARDLQQSAMQMNDENTNGSEARKKDKGNGMIMILGLMMSKMMAVMGLGGVGALAMKALGIAMTALMMAAMVGVKSMGHQANESSHSVQYVSAEGLHHKRRRRRNVAVAAKTPEKSTTNFTFDKQNNAKMDLSQRLVYNGWQK